MKIADYLGLLFFQISVHFPYSTGMLFLLLQPFSLVVSVHCVCVCIFAICWFFHSLLSCIVNTSHSGY